VYVISPSLEAALGISRDASDKPKKIFDALATLDVHAVPAALKPLVSSVKKLMNHEGT